MALGLFTKLVTINLFQRSMKATMFSFFNWRKPKWQHADAEIRRKAIESIDDDQILLQVIEREADDSIAYLAVDRLTDAVSLTGLMAHEREDIRNRARSRRLEQLLPGSEPAQLEQVQSEDDLLLIAALCEDEQIRSDAIERIRDPEKRLELAWKHPLAGVRYSAAEGIQDIPSLEALSRKSRGHDKRVYRLCRERIEAYRASERERHETDASIASWLTQAGQLADKPADSQTRRRLSALRARWEQLSETASDGQRQAAAHEIERISTFVDIYESQAQALEQRQIQLDAAGSQRAQLIEELEKTLQLARDNADTSALSVLLPSLEQRWAQACTIGPATVPEQRQLDKRLDDARLLIRRLSNFAQTEQEIESMRAEIAAQDRNDFGGLSNTLKSIRARVKALAWPESVAKPDSLRGLENELESLARSLQLLVERQSELSAQIQLKLAELNETLEAGSLKAASRMHVGILDSLKQLDHRHQQQFHSDLQMAAARLRSMHDWQNFATNPKKAALCEQMEALIDSELGPEPLAELINQLQQEWKALGAGDGRSDRGLWKRFKTAADTAYLPCKSYFEQQAQRRRERYTGRLALCDQLEQYESTLDWNQADWPTVQRTLSTAREAFNELSPVDRGAHHKSLRRFNAIIERIYAHLKGEYDKNLSQKEALVERVEGLLEHSDVAEAIELTKAAQEQWRRVGIVPRGPDQRLWRRFRSACDAVFGRRDEARKVRKAALDDAIGTAEQIIEDARSRVAAFLDDEKVSSPVDLRPTADVQMPQSAAEPTRPPGEQPDSVQAQSGAGPARAIEEAHLQLAELELPQRVLQNARASLDELHRLLGQRLRQNRIDAERARWRSLVDNIRACGYAALDERVSADALWSAEAALPPDIDADALRRRYMGPNESSATTKPLPFDNDVARRLCINMEILAAMEGPPQEQELRMHIQMQRLARGLGRGESDTDQECIELVNEWLAMMPEPEWEARFATALERRCLA